MRRGWPPLPPLLLLLPVVVVVVLGRDVGDLGAPRRPRGAPFVAYSATLDDLELLAQIADAPVDDGKLTCFTCNNVTDNDQCNRYAIDRPCEPGLSLCRTDHVIERVPVPAGSGPSNSRPRSVRITKSCVAASECSRAAVGCRGVAGDSTYLRVCTSCCDWSYCNELAPADSLTAVLAVSRSGAGSLLPPPTSLAWVLLALLAIASTVF